jgi:hypothetical protein
VALRRAHLDANPPCLEYEYIEGEDLGRQLRTWREGGPGDDRALRLMRELADIVAAAHRQDPPVVHRDLKPSNILLEQAPDGPRLRVTDFGIGGLATRQAGEQTTTRRAHEVYLLSRLWGAYTPIYASPEQVKGESPDPRDDVHALGVIWYQLLLGDPCAKPTPDWNLILQERGVRPKAIDLVGHCLASTKRRLPNAVRLAEELKRLAPPQEGPAGAEGPPPQGRTPPVSLPTPPRAPRQSSADPVDSSTTPVTCPGCGRAIPLQPHEVSVTIECARCGTRFVRFVPGAPPAPPPVRRQPPAEEGLEEVEDSSSAMPTLDKADLEQLGRLRTATLPGNRLAFVGFLLLLIVPILFMCILAPFIISHQQDKGALRLVPTYLLFVMSLLWVCGAVGVVFLRGKLNADFQRRNTIHLNYSMRSDVEHRYERLSRCLDGLASTEMFEIVPGRGGYEHGRTVFLRVGLPQYVDCNFDVYCLEIGPEQYYLLPASVVPIRAPDVIRY